MTDQTPKTYTKKPVTVEAMRWDGTLESAMAIVEWGTPETIPGDSPMRVLHTEYEETNEVTDIRLRIDTLEGTMEVAVGDYVIRGVKGEFYPCKPDIFAETYDEPRSPIAPVMPEVPSAEEPYAFEPQFKDVRRETFGVIVGKDVADYHFARLAMEERFITAVGGKPPTSEQREAVDQFQQITVELATAIEQLAPAGRNKSLALTHLEDALMRANRAVFATGESA